MKHFIVEITYTVPFEQLKGIVPLHRQFLEEGYQRGLLLCSGPLPSRTGGIVVARAASLEELQDFFDRDPYHLQDIATHHCVEFEPVKHQAFLAAWVSGAENPAG
ncbi:MAG: YciI family protein [Anaerolineaceae bacterium]|nr:YciI family protein [Anaerolineaceae bacterium]